MIRQTGNTMSKQPIPGNAPKPAQPSESQAISEVGESAFPIVGIGASAGGLAAFTAFFNAIPDDTELGMALVLVQHLAPDHKSILTELIQRNTKMQVFEVEDGMRVQINCAYIIPPNRDMAFISGCLHLLEPYAARGHRMPIDYFFRSLAQDQRELAIGIVLSGTGSDGTLGIRAIKGEGGMVMTQLPESSAFDGMPQSAVATGLVDYTLIPADMPAQLMRYVKHALVKPPHEMAGSSKFGALALSENALKKIFILLRTQLGHDFSNYKPSTICRRIERRMAVHQITAIDDYVRFLQQTPVEVESLFRDLLIGVTCFFRDPESFAVLAQRVIPKLFENKPSRAAVRVWSTGCSTGEEGYSIAILLYEHMETLKQNYQLQVFATDIDSRAIAFARAGIFPASISNDITPERLARFFAIEPDGASYRINKAIREMLIFSEHNIIKNPPFSKLDLITCRNLLIYLSSDLQKKLITLFHYALNPGGMLFLGTSETVGDAGDQFTALDRKSKLYQRSENFRGAARVALERLLPSAGQTSVAAQSGAAPQVLSKRKQSLQELTEQALLQQVALAAALVNNYGDILYLHGRTGMFLEPSSGEAGVNNILKMAREGLRGELTICLHKAAASGERVRAVGLRVKTNGHFTLVNVSICRVAAAPNSPLHASPKPTPNPTAAPLEAPLYLVILEEAQVGVQPKRQGQLPDTKHAKLHWSGKDISGQIAELHEELQAKDEFLHAANEELETSNEELKSSNEEMQSVNEELQSTNEELETSKEELQSINEELTTVNTELQSKVSDLSRVNNDMNNLLAGTGIGTVFVDYALRILRFTPAATQMINLIASDIGRPVGHIMSNMIGYDSLVSDIQGVLKTLIAKEIDVQIKPSDSSSTDEPSHPASPNEKPVEHRFYTLRILPYRTLENVIEGAVITFVEITEIVRAREAMRATKDLLRLAVVVRDATDAILVHDLNGQITAWNPGAVRMYGWTEAEALTMNTRDRIPKALREQALEGVLQLSHAQIIEPYRTERLTKDGRTLRISLTSTALVEPSGRVYAIATTERSIQAAAL